MLTWDEVKARSLEHIDGIGACFCWDCDLNYGSVQMPCAAHCVSDEERAERDRRFAAKISGGGRDAG